MILADLLKDDAKSCTQLADTPGTNTDTIYGFW